MIKLKHGVKWYWITLQKINKNDIELQNKTMKAGSLEWNL